ncbi:hypothetical protein BD626DRAFT_542703 [Schizophyllum amplum]|uniref:SAP domain-containing protein n=1 Tax=Schizophyllum amplum TaxID=97359 RepID=A0A550BSC1_9AGAR|nr:hypothetical protein BD626DRAFT_542703 [Auriculariopsis ampla]
MLGLMQLSMTWLEEEALISTQQLDPNANPNHVDGGERVHLFDAAYASAHASAVDGTRQSSLVAHRLDCCGDRLAPTSTSVDTDAGIAPVSRLTAVLLIGVCVAYAARLVLLPLCKRGLSYAIAAMSLKRARPIDETELTDKELEALPLPVPGSVDAKGGIVVRDVNLLKLSHSDLSKLCRDLGLPYSGNKTDFKTRLLVFSREKEKWNILKPGMTGNLKAPRTKKSGNNKLSTARREQLFATASDGSLVVSGAGTTAQDKEHSRKWAAKVLAACPYMPREERQRIAAEQAARASASTSATVLLDPAFRKQLIDDVREAVTGLSVGASPSAGVAGPPSLSASADIGVPAPCEQHHSSSPALADNPPCSLSVLAPPLPPCKQPAIDPPPASRTRDLVLPTPSGDVSFVLRESDLPSAPAGVGTDIARIACMWAYDGHWRGESALHLHGHPVPMQYWPDIFKYWHKGNWEAIKSDYVKWRDVAHMFWSRYSTVDKHGRGKRMQYTHIVKEIRLERKGKAEQLEAAARERFGAEFAQLFGYRKGSICLLYSAIPYTARARPMPLTI